MNKCLVLIGLQAPNLHSKQERLGWDPLQRYISDLNH